MKHKKIAEAFGEIDQEYIAQAAGPQKPRWPRFVAAAAAIVVVALLVQLLPIHRPGTVPILMGASPEDLGLPVEILSPATLNLQNLVAGPEYPKMAQLPVYENYENKGLYDQDLSAWYWGQQAQYDQPANYAEGLDEFWNDSIRQFLSGQEDNAVCSPVNIYMALAMLAECAEGHSRQQILELFGLSSIEALRAQAGHMWNAHYSADGATTLVLGNSLWLDHGFSYKQPAVDTLAKDYFASVFHGDLGTEDMNGQLQSWINSQTGGLLQKVTEDLTLDPGTAMALASTIYFSATWESKFSEGQTFQGIFHGKDADIQTQFLYAEFLSAAYYWGKDFGAVKLNLTGDHAMWLILPTEGKTVEDVLVSGEYLQMCNSHWPQQKQYELHLRLPKFDITGTMDLVEGLKQLGITDVFDPNKADFGGISDSDLFVSKANHGVRVAVDEEGCVAAGYTVVELKYGGVFIEEEVLQFTLDQPFLFVVTSRDQMPLFAGVVNTL